MCPLSNAANRKQSSRGLTEKDGHQQEIRKVRSGRGHGVCTAPILHEELQAVPRTGQPTRGQIPLRMLKACSRF